MERIDPPKPSNYRFYRDEDGAVWKVLVEVRPLRAPSVDAVQTLAPIEYSVHVSAAPATDAGHADRDDADRPIVGDAASFSFTEHHMRQPDFDPEATVFRMIEDRIAATRARLTGNRAILALGETNNV